MSSEHVYIRIERRSFGINLRRKMIDRGKGDGKGDANGKYETLAFALVYCTRVMLYFTIKTHNLAFL